MKRHLKIVGDSGVDKAKVVVVEEDPTYLHMWERVFSLIENCNYCITNDPKMVAQMSKDHPIDVLVSEVFFEKSTGFDLAFAVHQGNPNAEIVLTTAYDCDLSRFDLKQPKFNILHKPYQKIEDVVVFLKQIISHRDPRSVLDEDSFSENEEYPAVMEWKL